MGESDKKVPKGPEPSQPTNTSDQLSSNQDPVDKSNTNQSGGSAKEGNRGDSLQKNGPSNIPVSSRVTGEDGETSKRPSTPTTSTSNAPGSRGNGLGGRRDSSGRGRRIKKPQPINTAGSRGASGIPVSTAKTPASGGSGGPSSFTSTPIKNDPKRPWHTAPGFNPDVVSSQISPRVSAGQKTPTGNRPTSSLGNRGGDSPKTLPAARPTSSLGVRGESTSRLPTRSGSTLQILPGVARGPISPTTSTPKIDIASNPTADDTSIPERAERQNIEDTTQGIQFSPGTDDPFRTDSPVATSNIGNLQLTSSTEESVQSGSSQSQNNQTERQQLEYLASQDELTEDEFFTSTSTGKDTEAAQAFSNADGFEQLTAEEKGMGREVDSEETDDSLPGMFQIITYIL